MNTPSYTILGARDDVIGSIGATLLESRTLQNNMVIFPGKRPSYFLRKYLAEKLGKVYEPPLILSIDEFILYWQKTTGRIGKEATDIDAIAILYKEHRTDAGALFTGSKEGTPPGGSPGISLDEFFPWGMELFKAFEELKIQRVPMATIRSVDTYFDERPFFRDRLKRFSLKLGHFSTLYEKFYELMEARGLMTRSMLYDRLATDPKQSSGFLNDFEHILIAGFFSFTQSEKSIFSSIKDLPNVQFVFQNGPGLGDGTKFLSIRDESLNTDVDWSDCSVTFHKASDSHAQIFALNDVLQKEKKAAFTAKDAIVVPDPGLLFPVVNWTLPLARNDFNISMGYPIVSTPVYSMLENIFGLQERAHDARYPVDTYLRLMLHPYIKNIKCIGSSEVSRIIVHSLEEVLSANLGKTITLEGVEHGDYAIEVRNKKVDLLNFCRINASAVAALSVNDVANHLKFLHDHAIRAFESIQDIAGFAERILALVSLISEKSTANLHEYYDEFVYSLIEHLHRLRLSGLGALKFDRDSAYFLLIRNYLNGLSVPFTGTPLKGLQVLGFLETRNLKFRSVYFLDANEGIIPAGRKEDPLLPYEVRKHLGLTTYRMTEAIYKYYFYLLLMQADRSHVFYLDNQDTEPSRFVQRILWDIKKKNDEVYEDKVSLQVSFSTGKPSEVQKSRQMLDYLARNKSISPSSLDTYLRCQLGFYYQQVLGFEERADTTSDFEARDIGIIVHAILERFYEPKTHKPLRIDEADRGRLHRIIDEVFEKEYSEYEDGFSYIVKSQIRRRLQLILLQDTTEQKDIVIQEVEDWHRMPYRAGGYDIKLIGKIDRVDRRGGNIYIIDYKTGSSSDVPSKDTEDFRPENRARWKDRIKSVQLPFYIMLYRYQHPDIGINQMEATLLMLGKQSGKDMKTNLFDRGGRAQIDRQLYYDTCREVIDTLIHEIFNLDTPFAPADDPNTCKYCPFSVMCS